MTVSEWSGERSHDSLANRQLLDVLMAVRRGDFSARMPPDLTGLEGKVADVLNDIIERNAELVLELQRLKTAVGVEGKTHERASLDRAAGGWKESLDAVNDLVAAMARPTNEIGRVIGAVASGDLRQQVALEVAGEPLKGDFLQTARAANAMVEQLASFASEVTRVAREVGTEGKLGGQASIPGVSGTWKELTDSVNQMASNLTAQVRNIAEVTVAVANGDLSKKITVDVRGEILQLKDAINTMVDQLRVFAAEVTRVAREVGTEGKLGGQAVVLGVAGTWKDLTDSVNQMASNLTAQVRNIADVAKAIAAGDLTKQVTVDTRGEILDLKNTINTMLDQLNGFAGEVTRVAREVGTDGKLGGQATVRGVAGTWKELTDNVNVMAGNITDQVRNIAEVSKAIANGDLTKKITVDVRGEILDLKNTINTMVDQLNAFGGEVTRLAREVGTEGKLGGQAAVRGVAGIWKELTDNVNVMASNLTDQVRNIAEVTTAVAKGDLTKKITVDVQGEILELKRTINTMVDQLGAFASEVTRVAREVGTEGRLGGEARVVGVAGTWKDLTDGVNTMAANLTAQVRNIAEVTTAVATGDLTKKITVDVEGEILELKNTINTMVDQLGAFASEVTRVAREVGTEGRLGGEARVVGVAGTWKDLTDGVNTMAANLTAQVRNIAEVTTAVANGDLARKITVDVRGEILDLKNTINTMVDQLNAFAGEVTRVAREVGTEGKLGGQATVRGVGGVWKELTDNVNTMAANLTAQVRNIAEVTTAVANGDLARKITVDVRGEILDLKNTINTMVDQLNGFASEVTRVAREVGTEGKLGGQAAVPGVSGTWKDLTDNVNSMAGNLTAQVRNIADVTKAVATGDLSKKITVDVKGEILELKNTINTMVDQLNAFASEVTRVAREVGTEGMLGGQAVVTGVGGTWKDLTDSVNFMAGNLTAQVRNIAEIATAIAGGDLSKKITVDVKGEILELKKTINTMVDQLNAFASEVTRVAREVGTEGKLGGQADVPGVSGTWKGLTDNVNFMASNLTNQVRGIAGVVTAVANGDLEQSLTLEAKGEIAALADTINNMTGTLATFADQVTTVARKVGVEGELGGQASVPGASGTWKDLTENVNQLAANLTTQVRSIAEVSTAVTKGDLTRSITVEASGEVAALKDNINEMIRNLRETTLKNNEQDWLKTNLAKFSRMLQGQRDLVAVGNLILSELAPVVQAHQAVVYTVTTVGGDDMKQLVRLGGYAVSEETPRTYKFGEGLVGQCAADKRKIRLDGLPAGYMRIFSALGDAEPRCLLVLPILFEGEVRGVMELSSIGIFSALQEVLLDQLTESFGIVLHTIEANMRTEGLLEQSQSLASELQIQKQTLQETNDELQEKAQLLADQNEEVERKNREVEMARAALEEKAKQLALTSKYKSEFLANMSHELRTPLNSLLILSDQLARNPDGNLSGRQVEFCKTIHASGNDLLNLINDILDLAKIESGTVSIEPTEMSLRDLHTYVLRTFGHIAESKGVRFDTEFAKDLPSRVFTDPRRLQQVLKNLLSNAFKFTERGTVTLMVKPATSGWSPSQPTLDQAKGGVVQFIVKDTGIGIPPEKQQVVFEAFQQAEGSTSRKYGGTGLGLAISRELSRMLGGEIRLESELGVGSAFTLYLPGVLSQSAQPLVRTEPHPVSVVTHQAPVIVTPTEDASASGDWASPLAVNDDRDEVSGEDKSLLIVDNDRGFLDFVVEVARANGFKALATTKGGEAVWLARNYLPAAIVLDIQLEDIDGWRVLDYLKNDVQTRHIPIAIVSTDDQRERGYQRGARRVLAKPVLRDGLDALLRSFKEGLDQGKRRLLVVEDDAVQREEIVRHLSSDDVDVVAAGSGEEAIAKVRDERFDLVVTDLGLPDIHGVALLERLEELPNWADTPVIIHTARDLSSAEASVIRRHARAVVTKAPRSKSLVEKASLWLHRKAPAPTDATYSSEEFTGVLRGRRILLVDDDVRNIFAMTSLLERYEVNVGRAENGKTAIELVQAQTWDLVLMDIMMPEMDGYDTIRAIRSFGEHRNLPIIALTAKAMRGDRQKCFDAGASDYVPKPIDSPVLLSRMGAWLSENPHVMPRRS
ncbi:Putative SigmaB asociated two-component system sensor protein [Labilithrix luteola]|uniref:histidine kinase n=1 Tax=Labilithrix luteola TaxID=1391654 RepID=A0A0K1QAS8_9BACT|nr:HAMP domain-containing protein [Labilithrix luteola]AKV02844.1 Putative SigmaB asociated two-component system sensor protein [Labilithrix luteola]